MAEFPLTHDDTFRPSARSSLWVVFCDISCDIPVKLLSEPLCLEIIPDKSLYLPIYVSYNGIISCCIHWMIALMFLPFGWSRLQLKTNSDILSMVSMIIIQDVWPWRFFLQWNWIKIDVIHTIVFFDSTLNWKTWWLKLE